MFFAAMSQEAAADRRRLSDGNQSSLPIIRSTE